jgi:hypothetical protein
MPSCAQVRGGWARLFSVMPSKFRNGRPPCLRHPCSPLGNPGPSPRRSLPRGVYRHLPGTCVWNAVGLLYRQPLLVLEPGIQWFLNGKHTLGALSFCSSAARPEPLTLSSSSEAARVEASRGPDSSLHQGAVMGDILSAPWSSDVVVLGNQELGMP